ncbi:MAG: TonB-dependent receptor [Bryobacteraceae bacterium]
MHGSKHAIIAILAAFLFAAAGARAQNASSSLSATVLDPSGAVVPNAKVVLTNETTGSARDTVSNSSGFFDIVAIQPGSYSLTVSVPGFAVWERKTIVFNQGESRTLPGLVLQVKTATETVEVAAGAEAVAPPDTGESSQTLNAAMVRDLPIEGRDASELIKIMPGMGMNRGLAQSGWNSLTTQSNSGPVGQYSANGTQPYGALTITVDGANLLDPGNQGTHVGNINKDQIAEMTLLNSAYGAEYAKGPVTFQAIGKSGAAQFHGGIYVYSHLSSLDSTDAYLKSMGYSVSYTSVYPGGDIGGPVLIPGTKFNRKRDKLFFYIAPEGMNQVPLPQGHAYFVPTAQMLAGNFSPAYLTSLGKGFASVYAEDALQPTLHGAASVYPGGMVPQSLIDPTSLAYAATFLPVKLSQPDPASGYNTYFNQDYEVNRFELRIRLDYNISDNTKLFVSWNRQDEFDQNPIGIWYFPYDALPYPSPMPAHEATQVYSANLTRMLGPTLTNETVATLVKFLNPVRLSDPSAVNPVTVGMTGYKPLTPDPDMPQIPNLTSTGNAVPGYAAPAFGTSFYGGDFGKMSLDPSLADNLSKVAGTHSMKFGVYWDFAENYQPGGLGNVPQGLLNFDNSGATSSGNLMADFLTGRVQSFEQVPGVSVYDMKYSQYSLYAQDQWKALRRLTLTYGVRLDHMGQWYPTNGPGLAVWNQASYSDTAQAGPWTGLLWHARDNSIPRSGFPSRLFFPEPRVGFAFDLFGNGKTVLRGGFGVYRYQLSFNSAVTNGIYDEPANRPNYYILNPMNLGWNFAQYGLPDGGVTGLGTNIAAMQQGDSSTPYTESYNFTLSQRVPWRSLIEIQYSGNQSHDLLVSGSLGNLNKTPFGAYFLPDPVTGVVNDPGAAELLWQDYLPYRNYQNILLSSHAGYQNYNALQATWNKRTGLATFMVNYTFGKVLGIRDGNTDNGAGNGPAADPWNLKDNYGPLAYDHTQIFNVAYTIHLPIPIHRGNQLLGGLLNGWSVSGVVQVQSGAPIQPNSGGNLNLVTVGALNSLTWLGTNSAEILPKLTCDPRRNLQAGQILQPELLRAGAARNQRPCGLAVHTRPALYR